MELTEARIRRYRAGWITIGAVIFALLCWHAINFTWDDPFISFRYAENLASGNGLVFNEGQRVEGYTNLLWVLILAFFSFIGISSWDYGLLITAKIIGVSAAVISIWLVGKTFLRLSPLTDHPKDVSRDPSARYFALIPVMLMLTSIFYAAWTVSALETVLFGLVTLIANYIVLRDIESGLATGHTNEGSGGSLNIRMPATAGFIFFLVAIIRADGFIIFTSAFLCMLLFAAMKKIRWGYLLHLLWAFLLPSILVLIWRQWYYGDIFPNTFYYKAGFSWEHINWGLAEVRQAIFDIDLDGNMYALFGTPVPFILMFIPFLFRKTWANPRIMLIGFQAGGYLLYIIYKGFDWMGMFRFFTHIYPLLAILSGLGFVFVYALLVKPERKSPDYARTITILFLIFIIFSSMFGAKKFFTRRIDHFVSGFVKWPPPLMLEYHRDMGLWLRDQLQPDDLVACGEAGAIPYFSGARILDMMGLVDEHISRIKAEHYFQKFDADYVFSHKPDWLLLMGYLVDDGAKFKNLSFLVPYGDDIYNYPDFRTQYRLAHQEGDLLMYRRLGEGETDPPEWEIEYNPWDRMEITLIGE